MKRRRRLQHPGRESRHRKLTTESLLRTLGYRDKKGGLKLVRLWREWENVVGADVAELARPLGHREGALVLFAEDAIAAQQLTYYAPEILERVNSFLEQEVFDKVRFELLNGRIPLGVHQRPVAEASPAPPVAPKEVGGLLDKIDLESPVGRAYLAYLRRLSTER
jgi:Protein of unknown function (DUF721).